MACWGTAAGWHPLHICTIEQLCVQVLTRLAISAHLCVVGRAGALWRAGLELQVELRVVVAREGHGLAAVVVPGRELLEPAAREAAGYSKLIAAIIGAMYLSKGGQGVHRALWITGCLGRQL